MVFDEIYYAKAAQQILAGVEVTEERTHPPLSKLIIAAGILLAGDNAVGWRVASGVAGTLLVPVIFALAHTLFRNWAVAALAALLVALDGLVLVESRISKPDILLTLFLFATYAALWQYLRARIDRPGGPRGREVAWLYLAGLAAGFAVSTKWTAVMSLVVIPVMLVLLGRWRRIQISGADLRHMAAAFVAIPVAVYMLTYIPYFMLGHGAGDFVKHQISMLRFHATLTQGHPYQSRWWSWPLLLRPIWYEYRQVAPGLHQGILAVGNPIIWYAGLIAFVIVAVRAVRTRSVPEVFLVAGLVTSYVQYAFISRVLFLYHFLPALPFVIMALAVGLDRVRDRRGSRLVVAYLLLAAGWLVVYYPFLAGVPMDYRWYMRLVWFRSWI
jgi:dolichyl-phosphate-mannose--protein O-mannosyl transferase